LEDSFQTLLLEALADPEGAEYARLRESYAASDSYQPWVRDQEGLEELRMRMATGEWESGLKLVNELLMLDPLSIALRFMGSHIHDKLDDVWEASLQRTFANGLMRAVMRSGDGRSCENAICVLDTRELYMALDAMGLKATRSELRQENGRWIDVVTATGREDRLVYFDVDNPQSWLVKLHG